MPVLLIQYGRPGYVGRFRSDAGTALPRGERVVVRGPRGLEVGTVLCDATGSPDGNLLRTVTVADEAAADRADALGRDILAAATGDGAGLPVAFVDVEVSLDAATAVLHGLPWADCDADPLLAGLSDRFGVAVRLLDLSRTPTAIDPPESAGCGKPGCGSEGGGCGSGGGCSTGSCSKGAVNTAAQLTSYFADLRQKMEAAPAGRTPLA